MSKGATNATGPKPGGGPLPTGSDSPSSEGSGSAKPWEHAKGDAGSAGDPLAARFVESLSYDTRLYKHDIAGSIAHARMLAAVGLISPEDLVQIEAGLAEIQAEIEASHDPSAWPGWKTEFEDVHMCLEAALVEKIGDPGRKLHTGRSRNDQVALDLLLWSHDAVGGLSRQLERLCQAFVDLANRDGQIVMPSYTHLQRAQPIVAGAELMAWRRAFVRCRDRMAALLSVNQANPLGSGAIAGSSLPLDRQHTASALGVGQPTVSSIDATSSRDLAIDFVYALAMTAMQLSRWAEQWIIYATTEFGFVVLDGRYTTGSSMMPQKANPDMLELIRGRCGAVYGHLMALLTVCKGLPIGYNRDLQEDKRHVFSAHDCVSDCVEIATRIVETARFSEPRISQGLDQGFLDATSLAEYLVTKGVAFRTAHQIVGSLVRGCVVRGYDKLGKLSLEEMNEACVSANEPGDRIEQDVYDWLGPEAVVQRYQTTGNAGTIGLSQQLNACQGKDRHPGE